MKRAIVVLSCIVALAVTLAVAGDKTKIVDKAMTRAEASSSDGEQLYMDLCASCHGMRAIGNGPASPALSPPPTDLTKLSKRNGGKYPADWVAKVIAGDEQAAAHGSSEMPVWGKAFKDLRPDTKPFQREAFARKQIALLTDYLKTVQAH